MTRKILFPLVTATAVFSSACSLVFAAPSTAPGAAPTATYTLDAGHTNVIFNLSHMGYSHYYGRFNKSTGTLAYDSKAPEQSKLDVTIETASIDTNNAKLEEELKSPGWLDAVKYPTIKFTSTTIEKTSDKKGKLTGNLTLHGVTRPVVLDVTFNGGGVNPISNDDALGFSATTMINRADYDIIQYLPMVGDTVSITIETEFLHKR